jgi:hypothetical protein
MYRHLFWPFSQNMAEAKVEIISFINEIINNAS